MEKAKMLSVLLLQSEHEILQEMADNVGIKKSEFVRSLIQGAYVAHSIQKAMDRGESQASIKYGGYGFEINFDVIMGIFKNISTQLDGLEDAINEGVKVNYNSIQRPLVRRIKPSKLKKPV
jgi:hypothetical protein